MSILFHNKGQIVQLSNDTISYVMEIVDGKYLVHRYFGRKIRNYRGTGNPLYFKRGYNTEHDSSVENVSLMISRLNIRSEDMEISYSGFCNHTRRWNNILRTGV